MKYSMRSACAQHFSRVVGPLAQVAVADASEFLIRHNRNELRAACGALSLVESGSEHELLDRLLSAARDVASTSLTMQHSKSISDLMSARDTLSLDYLITAASQSSASSCTAICVQRTWFQHVQTHSVFNPSVAQQIHAARRLVLQLAHAKSHTKSWGRQQYSSSKFLGVLYGPKHQRELSASMFDDMRSEKSCSSSHESTTAGMNH